MTDLGLAIRAARLTAGVEAQQLAERLGLTKSQMSKIEAGSRAVKAGEIIDIAEALGVSPMALLRPGSTAAQVALAARTVEATAAQESLLMDRLRGILDLAEVLPPAVRAVPTWAWKPQARIEAGQFVRSSTALADWARNRIGPVAQGSGRFASISSAVAQHLGVDVLVERFVDPDTGAEDQMLGGAIVHDDFHLVAINATSLRSRALFTLGHELGHVLQGDGIRVSQDANFSPTSPEERFANAFAAAFLLPEEEVLGVLTAHGHYLPDTVAALMQMFDASKQTAVYRLHNLGRINAGSRDQLLQMRPREFAAVLRNPNLTEFVTHSGGERLADRAAQPLELIRRVQEAYVAGTISAAPLASLLGISVEEAIDRYGELGRDARDGSNELTPEVLMAAQTAEPSSDSYDDTPA